jgi:hypothetical protein
MEATMQILQQIKSAAENAGGTLLEDFVGAFALFAVFVVALHVPNFI